MKSKIFGRIQGTDNEIVQEEKTPQLFPNPIYKSSFTQFFRKDGSKFVSSNGLFRPETEEELQMMAYYESKGLAFEERK